jgi:hypothetical protein
VTAEQTELELLRRLAGFAGHVSPRCNGFRTGNTTCWCGLDELTDKLGMPRVLPIDAGDVPLEEGLTPITGDPFDNW